MSNSRTLHPEDQIAQYRVVGPLGAGGMGEVYLAQDQSLERSVALKVLPHELTRSEDRVRRFVQEAKSASSLNHPNIVTIYEIGQEPVKSVTGGGDSGPLHYISMELISGKTLGAKIHEEKTDLRSLVGYLAQAAEGIAKAHAVGIVHRDLKPGNIMVSDDGFAKVLDFGLAKLLERTAGPNEATEVGDKTTEGAVMGTVNYMSPEQVQGKPVDARSDIFSFGAILYEAATRQRPFMAESNVEIMHKILNEKPRAVEELNAAVPAELRRVIRRCLAKAPEQRAQSMKDIAIELREIFDEYDALSASNTSATQTVTGLPRAVRRRNPLVLTVVLVSIVAVAAIAFGLLRGRKSETAQPFQNMRVSALTSRGDVIDCAISPDGRYLAYVAGRSGQTTLRVRQVATGSDVEVIPMNDGNLEFPCFTPDGNYLFYCRRKPDAPLYRVLMSVPSLGGPEQERGFDVDSRVAFSPDGKRVAFVRGVPQKNYSALLVLDLDTKKETEFAQIHGPGGPIAPPSWSPDGKLIAVAVVVPPPAGGTTVAVFDAQSGQRRDVFKRDGAFVNGLAWLTDGKGFALSGFDLASTVGNQLFTLSYPGSKYGRVTNDFSNYGSVSSGTGSGGEAIAAVRASSLMNVYVVDPRERSARAITAITNPEQSPFGLAAANDRVYFSAVHGEFLGLHSLSLSGGEPVWVPTGNGHVLNIKARGGTVAFRQVDADQQTHVWRVNPDGTGVKQVSTGGGENLLDLSPDGTMVTFAYGDSSRSVWIMPVAGGEPRCLSRTALTTAAGFSSDGRHVVTAELEEDHQGLIRNVFKVIALDSGNVVSSVRFPPTGVNFGASPDRMVTYSDRADPAWNLFKVSPGDGKTTQLTRFTDGRVTGHLWSNDGKSIALVRRMGDGENVWLVDANGSNPRQVTHFSNIEVAQVIWTPDSARLVCSAGQSGSDAVLVRSFR